MNGHKFFGHRWAAITAVLGVAWLLLWIGLDRWQSEPDPEFYLDTTPLLAWYVLATIVLAAILRSRSAPTPKFAASLALATGMIPVPLLLATVGTAYLSPLWFDMAVFLGCTSLFLYFARGLHALTGGPQRVAALCGLIFLAAFVWATDALDVIPDFWMPRDTPSAAVNEPAIDGERLLFEQAARIDEILHGISVTGASVPGGSRPGTPGFSTSGPSTSGPSTSGPGGPVPRAFFLGFAGVGDEKVFAQEIGLASRVLGERYDIGDRTLSLVNDERDLDAAPIASVSGLTYALHEMAARMHIDRDILFLSISSHGAQDPAIIVSNSQLPLNDLTPDALAEALEQSGIRWRVIVVSACYAGGFIDSLKNPQTIVITAAAADRTSFGCGSDSDLTYFGEAFYRDALPDAKSLRDAFDKAKVAIAERERSEHVEASKPQAYFGPEIEKKLTSMGAHVL